MPVHLLDTRGHRDNTIFSSKDFVALMVTVSCTPMEAHDA